jgi:hypothetical protein
MKTNNTRWQEAEAFEMGQLLEYETFDHKGIAGNVPSGYKRILCQMIYDMKHEGSHKAQFVAGGNLTEPNTESAISGVVSLQGIRSIVFLTELNKFQLWVADVTMPTLKQQPRRRFA